MSNICPIYGVFFVHFLPIPAFPACARIGSFRALESRFLVYNSEMNPLDIFNVVRVVIDLLKTAAG
jgi:hypothetical protein